MKILKHGFYAHTINCNCGCVYQYDKKDIGAIEKFTNTKLNAKQYYVRCPECKEMTYIPEVLFSNLQGELTE